MDDEEGFDIGFDDESKEGFEVEDAAKEGDEGEVVEGEKGDGEHVESEHVPGEHAEGEEAGAEHVEGEHVEGEQVEGEHVEGDHEIVEDEHVEGEHIEGEHVEGEHTEGEHIEGEETVLGEGEELMGEQAEGEVKGEETAENAEDVEEEQGQYVEEPPPDPAAPFNFRDSQEAIKPHYELRVDQLAEVEQLWECFQNYTPAYTDIDGYITEKELIYMLKSLMLMTYTPEQLEELIAFCVRPPHPEGHITFDQFVHMVTLRQREFPVEDELRSALQVFDPGKTGEVSREQLKDVLAHQGHKMPQKQLDNLIKEVDMSNDGTLGIEDIVGTMCIDLNPEDIIMLRNAIYPPDEKPQEAEEEF